MYMIYCYSLHYNYRQAGQIFFFYLLLFVEFVIIIIWWCAWMCLAGRSTMVAIQLWPAGPARFKKSSSNKMQKEKLERCESQLASLRARKLKKLARWPSINNAIPRLKISEKLQKESTTYTVLLPYFNLDNMTLLF